MTTTAKVREINQVIVDTRRALHLKPMEFAAVLELHAAGPMPTGEVAARIGVSRAGMTAIADHLEQGSWVRRTRGRDQRQVYLELTRPACERVRDAWTAAGGSA